MFAYRQAGRRYQSLVIGRMSAEPKRRCVAIEAVKKPPGVAGRLFS
jgi:hypothetical protein